MVPAWHEVLSSIPSSKIQKQNKTLLTFYGEGKRHYYLVDKEWLPGIQIQNPNLETVIPCGLPVSHLQTSAFEVRILTPCISSHCVYIHYIAETMMFRGTKIWPSWFCLLNFLYHVKVFL